VSTTSTPTTFTDLYTDGLNRVRASTSDSTAVTMMKRYVNQALHDVHIQQNWEWAERREILITHPTYATGDVSIAAATRTTLEGSGSPAWNTAVTGIGYNNMRAGGKVTFDNSEVYTISSVASDTSATLTNRYLGGLDTATSYALAYGSYTYFEDEYALASDFFRLIDNRKFSDAMPIPVLGRQEFYRRFPRNRVFGTPVCCTLIELGPSGSVSPRKRVVFHPAPDDTIQIPYRYITTNLAVDSTGTAQTNLSADSDEPIIPLRYRHVLVFYAIAQWYRDRKDDQRTQLAKAEYDELIKRMAGDSDVFRDHPRFASPRAIYLAGVAGPRRGNRFSADSRFDQMRDS
jgi:hypothetical protein